MTSPKEMSELPDVIYVYRHGDDEPMNGNWFECQDSEGAWVKYHRADTSGGAAYDVLMEKLEALKLTHPKEAQDLIDWANKWMEKAG